MERICPPTRFDPAPYGTLCTVKGEDKDSVYIQISQELDHPDWITIGDFFAQAFQDQLADTEFMADAMSLYRFYKDQQ